jgi:hypothetical protein
MSQYETRVAELKRRISVEQADVALAFQDCKAALRSSVAVPRTLLGFAGVGFLLGKAIRQRPARVQPAKKKGLAGILAAAAVSVLRMRYGNPWAVVPVLAHHWLRRKEHPVNPFARRARTRSTQAA